jgi:hypothetical protein
LLFVTPRIFIELFERARSAGHHKLRERERLAWVPHGSHIVILESELRR